MKRLLLLISSATFVFMVACRKDNAQDLELSQMVYDPTSYNLELPKGFPPMPIPDDNPLTVEGVELGRKLFFEKRLSVDNSISCSSCHAPENAFSDSRQFSLGINGQEGNRQAMVIQNIAWSPTFFWDGRAKSLETQALAPVTNPIEMHETWPNVANKLNENFEYQKLFYKAFGSKNADSTLVTKALAQFMRTLVSGNSKYDKWLRGEVQLTPEELSGFDLFKALDGGDCIHCHPINANFTDFSFHNNGLDATLTDLGLGGVNGNTFDEGKFKVPTLRNIEFSAPYMHDGRFETLDEVIDFYSEGVHPESPNVSPLMEFKDQGGVLLTAEEKAQLKAFLLTLSDPDFINNPNFQAP